MTTDQTDPQETPAIPTPPAKQKTAVGKIIQSIEKDVASVGVFIGKEAGIVGKLFSSEAPVIQADLKAVSGALQIIKTNLDEAPAIVIYLIKKSYPQFNPATLQTLLTKAVNALGIAEKIVAPTLEETIANLQAHAAQLATDDVAHNNFWTGLFNVLGILISPGTPWGKIVTFGVYIYNTYFKPKA